MKEREEVIRYCQTFDGVYEDYPFRDANWTVMRCRKNKKSFAYIYERESRIWVNVKCSPEWIEFWRNAFSSVVPAYHMNKTHWNSIILDGSIPDSDVKRMIAESYDLVCGSCPCRFKSCKRHGDCEACISHHREDKKHPLPACGREN